MSDKTQTTTSGDSFRAEVEQIRTDIFYWMIRNHDRGEQSYAKLGEVKERLTEVLQHYE